MSAERVSAVRLPVGRVGSRASRLAAALFGGVLGLAGCDMTQGDDGTWLDTGYLTVEAIER